MAAACGDMNTLRFRDHPYSLAGTGLYGHIPISVSTLHGPAMSSIEQRTRGRVHCASLRRAAGAGRMHEA